MCLIEVFDVLWAIVLGEKEVSHREFEINAVGHLLGSVDEYVYSVWGKSVVLERGNDFLLAHDIPVCGNSSLVAIKNTLTIFDC
ncbi:MAG: hypothetical protein H6765_08460 [Candidatus Peribacteria bacterium]|nr:MAG: hypothetical protein H6765_08460 [Candidatus Peribacteria bacterium]